MIPTENQRLLRQLTALAAAGLLLWLAGDVVMVLLGSLLVAVFLHGAASWVNRQTRLSEPRSLLIVVVLLVLTVVSSAWLLAPSVMDQVDQLSKEMPQALDRLTAALETNAVGRWLLQQGESIGDGETGGGGAMDGMAANAARFAGTAVSGSVNALAYFVLAVAIGLYLAAGFKNYRQGFIRLFAPAKRHRVGEIIEVSIRSLEGWLIGIAVSMFVLGAASFAGLSLLGVPLALTFALFTAVLTFIPNLGPIVSVIPPALMGLTVSPRTSLYVLIFYLILQNVEGLVITPKVQARAASIPPPILLSVQVLMAALWGFYGLVVAAPLCAAGIVLIQMIYLEDRLGERVLIPGYTSRAERAETAGPPQAHLDNSHLVTNQLPDDGEGGAR